MANVQMLAGAPSSQRKLIELAVQPESKEPRAFVGPLGSGIVSANPNAGRLDIPPLAFSFNPLPSTSFPTAGMPRPFLRMSGQALAATHFQAPDSFGSELRGKRPTECQFFAGIHGNSFGWQASGATLKTGSIIRSKASPEEPQPRMAG